MAGTGTTLRTVLRCNRFHCNYDIAGRAICKGGFTQWQIQEVFWAEGGGGERLCLITKKNETW